MTATRVLFARFLWPDRDPVAALHSVLGENRELSVFRGFDSDEGCVYVASPADAPQEQRLHEALHATLAGTVSRLELLMEIAGASASDAAPYHYIVETDVLAEHEADFNAWYDREHLPGLASVAGTVQAMRYQNRDGHPRYHACYDLARRETLGSPPWLAVRATPWSDRIRPAFFNTRRTMYRRVA